MKIPSNLLSISVCYLSWSTTDDARTSHIYCCILSMFVHIDNNTGHNDVDPLCTNVRPCMWLIRCRKKNKHHARGTKEKTSKEKRDKSSCYSLISIHDVFESIFFFCCSALCVIVYLSLFFRITELLLLLFVVSVQFDCNNFTKFNNWYECVRGYSHIEIE